MLREVILDTLLDSARLLPFLFVAYLAIELESEYSKEQILEWYLNIIPLGESNYGVKAAAKDYYDKDLSELTLRECASLAAITRNPSRYNPRRNYYGTGEPSIIDDRTDYVLECMYDNGFISKAEYDAALADSLTVVEDSTVNDLYDMPSAVETVLDDAVTELLADRGLEDTSENRSAVRREIQEGGYHIYSTIDPEIQNIVEDVLYNWEDYPELADPSDEYASSTQAIQPQAACVIYDYHTGEIRAVVGSRTPQTQFLVLNRATDSNMPVGSSIKPLAVYAPAIEFGLITPSTLVNDAPREEVEMSQDQWYPKNSDWKYRGYMDIATAVRLSINTVAAQVLDKLGLDASTNFLKNKLGITSLVADDYNYASLALGELTNGISVLEMTQAYCAFDNAGIFTEARTYTKVTDAAGNLILDNQAKTHVAMKSSTATNITDMLYSAANYGTGREAVFSGQAIAGKTGTSSYNWNRWFAGYTPYYVGVVWTGFDQPEQINIYGNPAAQVWRRVMQQVHAGLEYKSFPAADWIGGDTQIFGDLTEEKEQQDNPTPSPSPSEEPEVEESPEVQVTDSPVVTDSPELPEQPAEPSSPGIFDLWG